jgi:hypothetical protein
MSATLPRSVVQKRFGNGNFAVGFCGGLVFTFIWLFVFSVFDLIADDRLFLGFGFIQWIWLIGILLVLWMRDRPETMKGVAAAGAVVTAFNVGILLFLLFMGKALSHL